MNKKIKVKPARPDLIVRDPITMQKIPVEGAEIELNSYWQRRIQDKDLVVIGDEPVEKEQEIVEETVSEEHISKKRRDK